MVLLVIDAQMQLMNDSLYNYELFEANLKTLIREARKNQVEIIYVRHEDGEQGDLKKGTAGYEIYDGFKPEAGEKIFDKNVNSAWKNTGLLEYLQDKGEKDVMMAGLQTDYCIDATVKCGFGFGFHMIMPAQANTTVDNSFMTGEESYRYYNEFMWKGRYAECIGMESAVRKLSENNSFI